MKISDTFDVTITDDNHNGNGFIKIKNIPVFVKNALSGEKVKIKITKITKKYAIGEIIKIYKPSPSRKQNICPSFNSCGGCNLCHISYEKEISLKSTYLKKLFKNAYKEFISFSRLNYRNKVTLHISSKKFGFYDEKSNNITQFDTCYLLDNEINKFITFIKNFDYTNIKKMVIRKGDNGLLFNYFGTFPKQNLKKLFTYPLLISVYKDDELIYGKPYINISYSNIKYSINHKAFFQINNECGLALYEKIKSYCQNSKKVLDLYCGIASIGLYLGNKTTTGIEINPFSVECAKINIKENNSNYKIILGDSSSATGNYDTIIIDPPRSGLTKKVIETINKIKPKKIIYISCNPSTLKRDISLLTNYHLKEVTGFNMFPLTKHIETISLLEVK